MIDLKNLKKNKDYVTERFAARGIVFEWDLCEQYESRYLSLSQQLQSLQQQRNTLSQAIGKAKAQGQNTQDLQNQVMTLKDQMEEIEKQLAQSEADWNAFCQKLPNIADLRTPIGKSEEDNIVLKTVLQPQRLEGLDHTQILEKSGLLMMEMGAKLSGSRFSVLKGTLAKLHRALIQFMLDFHEKNGNYTEYYVPYAVHRKALFGTGQLPKFEEDLFHLEGDRDLFLIPTAEVPVTNFFADTISTPDIFPVRMMAHTPCFRSEAGAYGKDIKGFFRQHQFEKVELVHCLLAEQADQEFDFLVQHVSNLLTALELPHQWTALCTQDLGFSACRTIDLEVWLPGQQRYREISSCSHFGDFQARRMKARYKKDAHSSTEFIHTINGSGVAVGRALIAIIENHGTEEGCFIPRALRPFVNGQEFLNWK